MPSKDVKPFACFNNAVVDARSLGLAVWALFCALQIIPLARLSMEIMAAAQLHTCQPGGLENLDIGRAGGGGKGGTFGYFWGQHM